MSWVGWRCQKCRHEFRKNQRFCPQCGYTVYDPIQAEERPDWIVTAPDSDLPRLAPGTYLLTKRVVVKEDGLSEFVDEPGGELIAGFFPRTRTRVTPVVDDYTAGEDYGSGPTRYYLTVNTPNDLTEHLAAVLFPGLDWLFKAVADWQSLWDEKEEWEKAAKEAWKRETVLSWLHAEAVWHAKRHRADVDTQDLSLALQRAGFRSMKDQCDAMAQRIREQDAELAEFRAEADARAEAFDDVPHGECTDPPALCCSDAGCPEHGDRDDVEEDAPEEESVDWPADVTEGAARTWPPGSPEPDRDVAEVADNENVFVRNQGTAGGWMWECDGIVRAGLRFEWEFINQRELVELLRKDRRG